MQLGRAVYRILWIAALVGLSSCKFSCSAGGKSPEKVAQKLKQAMKKQSGVDVEVTCPELNDDGVTECTAKMANGGAFIIEVKTDDDGFDWQSRGIAIGTLVEARVKEFFRSKLQITLDTLTCPKLSLLQDGGRIACTANSQGVDIAIDVTTSSSDLVDVLPKSGLVDSRATSRLVVKAFAEKNIQVKPDCGPPVRLSVPGTTFTCTATDADGVSKPVYFKINNKDGNVNMSSEPF